MISKMIIGIVVGVLLSGCGTSQDSINLNKSSNEYGFYGFIDPKNNKFKIVVTGGKNRGRVCTSFTKVEHMNMF